MKLFASGGSPDAAGGVTSSNAWLTVVVPPTLALQFSAGYLLLNLNGRLGNNFVVQYNINLAESNWIHLLSLTNLSASPYQFLDPAGSGPPARFCRAVMQRRVVKPGRGVHAASAYANQHARDFSNALINPSVEAT